MGEPFQYDIFISYSSADVTQAEALENWLKANGLKVWRDKSELRPGDHVEFSVPEALKNSATVAVLWSENSVKSDWVKHEASYAVVEGKALTLSIAPFEYKNLSTVFRGLNCGDLAATLADPSKLLDRYRELRANRSKYRRIDLSKLPDTYAKKLYGRKREMAALKKAWDKGGAKIFAFDAMGGAGKTALVYHFVQALKASGWRGAQSVFAWSFYSQGSNEDRQTSADDFFKAAFRHFGGKEPPRDPREKGVELAHLVQGSRALLILDGLEPLQYVARGGRTNDAKVGGVKDPGIKALLSLLADSNPGLCLVTTRIRLAELAGNTSVTFEELERLPLMAGIELLRDLGVEPKTPPAQFAVPQRAEFVALVPAYAPPPEYTPPPADAHAAMPPQIAKDLITAVEELKGHALALTLVGNYLAEHHHGDIRAIHDLPALAELRDAPERSPYRVMRAIEIALARRIEEEDKTEKPAQTVAGRELALLFFLGLFDRPAELAHLPVVFPQDAAQVLQPEAADLALAAREIPIEKQLDDLKLELAAGVRDWRRKEIAREEAALKEGWTEAHEAARRVLVRRAFAGMAEAARDRRLMTEALHELTRRGLVSNFSENAGFDKASVDCHPLVREYFGARLKELDRETFKAAHGRLYDHYRYGGLPAAFREPVAYGVLALKAAYERDHYPMLRRGFLDGSLSEGARSQVPPSIAQKQPPELRAAFELVEGPDWPDAKAAFLPEDEAGMTPPFAAIAHGCAAEREDETFTEVYLPRIARGNQNFAATKLGLFGQELAALAAFYEMPFTTPSPRLSPMYQALALNFAGYRLRALGRLEDAVEPMRAAVSLHIGQEIWERASAESGNLSELLLTIGRLGGEDGAVSAGEEAVVFADRSGHADMRMGQRTTHADALAQAGRLAGAEALYSKAEALQKEMQPDLPRLYSLQGYRYCDLLLARSRTAETAVRAEYMIARSLADAMTPTLTLALEIMTQARAALAEAPLSAPASNHGGELSNDALAALRRANQEAYIVPGLLVHAEAHWRCGNAKAADDPLREAETIAARGPMPLFMAQVHLLRARIALSQNNLAAAKAKCDAALELIQRHGYGRAAPEAAVLNAEIACAENAANRDAAIAAAVTAIRGEPHHDERTGITIDGGWWGLYPRLELLLSAADPRLADLRAARDAYNAERDAYLRSTLAKDVEDYHPGNDPIAAYLGVVDVWEEEDRALADPGFRRELSEALVRSGYKPLDETSIAEQRNAARQYLKLKREAESPEEAPDLPEIPDELLDQVLADATACESIETMLKKAGVKEPLKTLPRETQRQAVAAFSAMLEKLKESAPADTPQQPARKKRNPWWWPFGRSDNTRHKP